MGLPVLLVITGVLLVLGLGCVGLRWYKEAFFVALPLVLAIAFLLKALTEVPS